MSEVSLEHLLESPEGAAGVSVGQVCSPVCCALWPPLALALPSYDLLRSTCQFREAAVSGHASMAEPIPNSFALALPGHNDCARGAHAWACWLIRTASLVLQETDRSCRALRAFKCTLTSSHNLHPDKS